MELRINKTLRRILVRTKAGKRFYRGYHVNTARQIAPNLTSTNQQEALRLLNKWGNNPINSTRRSVVGSRDLSQAFAFDVDFVHEPKTRFRLGQYKFRTYKDSQGRPLGIGISRNFQHLSDSKQRILRERIKGTARSDIVYVDFLVKNPKLATTDFVGHAFEDYFKNYSTLVFQPISKAHERLYEKHGAKLLTVIRDEYDTPSKLYILRKNEFRRNQ